VAGPAVKFPCADAMVVTAELEPAPQIQTPATSSKSVGKAFVLSLLLPGLGEWYAGSATRAKVFMAAEAAIWSTFAVYEHRSSWKKRDYQLYAVNHAAIDPDGKDDDFYKRIGQYSDVYTYNEEQLHFRDMDDVYWDDEFYFWEWDSHMTQAKYTELRESSRKSHRRALNMVGAAVLNRLLSGIDAIRTAKSYNKALTEHQTGFNLDFKLKGSLKNPKAMVVLERTF
jgi:hypothetical protein